MLVIFLFSWFDATYFLHLYGRALLPIIRWCRHRIGLIPVLFRRANYDFLITLAREANLTIIDGSGVASASRGVMERLVLELFRGVPANLQTRFESEKQTYTKLTNL